MRAGVSSTVIELILQRGWWQSKRKKDDRSLRSQKDRKSVVPRLTSHVNDSSLVGSATAMSRGVLFILSVEQ